MCVKIDNTRGKDFGSHIGVRQGDHFSPFLFNLAAEGMAKLIKKAQNAGHIIGLVPHLVSQGIAIFQCVDDTILFVHNEENQVRHLKIDPIYV